MRTLPTRSRVPRLYMLGDTTSSLPYSPDSPRMHHCMRGAWAGACGRGDVEESETVIVMSTPDPAALARVLAVVLAAERAVSEPASSAGIAPAASCSVPAAPSTGKAEFAKLLKGEFSRLMVSGCGLTANEAAAQAMVYVKAKLAAPSPLPRA